MRLKRIHPATVIATAALVLAATGGASGATRAISNLIGGGQIQNHSITSKDLAPNSIIRSDIAAGAVGSHQVAAGAIGARQLAPAAIHRNNIAPGSITTDDLADFAVTNDKLDLNSVTSDRLVDGSVTTGKLADGAVTQSKIGAGEVGTGQLAAGSVTYSKLAPLGPINYVGQPGNPPFIGNAGNSNTNVDFSEDGNVGYYLGNDGLVHLTGRADPSTLNQNPNQLFTLPAALAPAHRLTFLGECPCGAFGDFGLAGVIVFPGGGVNVYQPHTSLSGISFRPGE
jgi:hypothetical protein